MKPPAVAAETIYPPASIIHWCSSSCTKTTLMLTLNAAGIKEMLASLTAILSLFPWTLAQRAAPSWHGLLDPAADAVTVQRMPTNAFNPHAFIVLLLLLLRPVRRRFVVELRLTCGTSAFQCVEADTAYVWSLILTEIPNKKGSLTPLYSCGPKLMWRYPTLTSSQSTPPPTSSYGRYASTTMSTELKFWCKSFIDMYYLINYFSDCANNFLNY